MNIFGRIIFKLIMALLLAVCAGCNYLQDPAFLTGTTISRNNYTKSELIRYNALSNECANLGWSDLSKYFNNHSWIPAINKSYIGDAMRTFNMAWEFNPENYQVYWGSGIIRGVQATLVNDEIMTERYLKQSISFMLIAKKKKIPNSQKYRLNLDLANGYNGLGAFYLKYSKVKLANKNFELARDLLLDVTKNKPDNGRAFYLLAVTLFYQGKYKESKQKLDQAIAKGFKVPEDFLKNLLSRFVEKKQVTDTKNANQY